MAAAAAVVEGDLVTGVAVAVVVGGDLVTGVEGDEVSAFVCVDPFC